jgi:hypothetical protein
MNNLMQDIDSAGDTLSFTDSSHATAWDDSADSYSRRRLDDDRDLAWNNTEMPWAQHNTSFLYNKSVASLAHTVGTTGRMLVTPVVSPPSE